MYKVVIIDDEPIIVKGLSKIVPWEKYNCKVVGTAGDGIEGQRLIKEEKPDILFTDIAMPGEDGLTMIAALKSEAPDLKITILTGYRDFDFAQRAINLGVIRYLLKPSNMDEIEEALLVMKNQLEALPIKQQPVETEDKAEVSGSFIVKKALAYIRANFNKKLTLLEVADQVYVSQWHLSKLLNRHTEQKFSDILNNIRIEEAKKLLDDPSLKIGVIAEKVGFLDITHFSRVFKKITGVSANEFRNHISVKDTDGPIDK